MWPARSREYRAGASSSLRMRHARARAGAHVRNRAGSSYIQSRPYHLAPSRVSFACFPYFLPAAVASRPTRGCRAPRESREPACNVCVCVSERLMLVCRNRARTTSRGLPPRLYALRAAVPPSRLALGRGKCWPLDLGLDHHLLAIIRASLPL